ncbi:Leucyl/phenylalanyl-tRNA--protein transferase [hydrothermal vent metagenome]|uniref:Leucyl/phenylalanyl-tRNA--protein transferase n=1 Tax=hydrothermal vent metagenome TaxID=652676 RepID=A0A3B0YN68_9ZZZZ
MHVYLIKDGVDFPPPELASSEPNGLLATGGDLSPERLVSAYSKGIFPWYSEGEPILWWSPDPRSVLLPAQLKLSRSLRKVLRKNKFRVTMDTDFNAVMRACAAPRRDEPGTWISPDMMSAYEQLFEMGIAHSVECYENTTLVGGLYGVAIDKVFFGESMFSRRSDASKVAFAWLVRQLQAWKYQLIDCQIQSDHLDSLGAHCIPREQFSSLLKCHCVTGSETHKHWKFDLPADYWQTE